MSVVVVPICSTVSVRAAEALPLLSVSPLYVAIKWWVPGVRFAKVTAAVPLLPTAAVPYVLAPSAKVTVPVGVGPVPPSTVAVSVTAVPTGTEALLLATVVIVEPCWIVSVKALEVEGAFWVSPAYCTVMLWAPTASVLEVTVACPDASVAVPREVAPSRKVTAPVGVPVAAEATTVKVTALVTTAGFADEESVKVACCLTTWLSAADVAAAFCASPA